MKGHCVQASCFSCLHWIPILVIVIRSRCAATRSSSESPATSANDEKMIVCKPLARLSSSVAGSKPRPTKFGSKPSDGDGRLKRRCVQASCSCCLQRIPILVIVSRPRVRIEAQRRRRMIERSLRASLLLFLPALDPNPCHRHSQSLRCDPEFE